MEKKIPFLDEEKACEKTTIMVFNKIGVDGYFLHVKKHSHVSVCLSVYICTKASIMVNSEHCKHSPLKSGTDFRGPQSTLLFNHILAVPASTIRQRKKLEIQKLERKR